MAKLTTLQDRFSGGMRQDGDRARMPAGTLWNCVDMLPDLGAYPLAKRGGWAYASPDLNGVVSGGSAYAVMVAYAPFSGGSKLLVWTNTGKAALIASVGSASDLGSTAVPRQTPVMHNDLLVIPNSNGTSAPSSYDGTTLGALGGSPPAGIFAAVFKGHTALGGATATKNKIYWSAAGNAAATWDTTNSWSLMTQPITGMAALPNLLLVFMAERTARIRGNIPPGNTNDDFAYDDPIFNVGCSDARSIAVHNGSVIFANPTGVYISNGSNQPEDLTATCGIKRYWSSRLTAYSPTTWFIAGGVFRNRYIVNIIDFSGGSALTFVDAFVFDLERRTVTRMSNSRFLGFARGVNVQEELYTADANDRVTALSSIFTPSSTYKNDADGGPVIPTWSMPLYEGRQGRKRWRALHLDYDLKDAASDNPTVTVAISREEDATDATPADYTAYVSGTLPETTKRTTKRIPAGFQSQGLTAKFTQTAASSRTVFYGLHADVHPVEQTRRGP